MDNLQSPFSKRSIWWLPGTFVLMVVVLLLLDTYQDVSGMPEDTKEQETASLLATITHSSLEVESASGTDVVALEQENRSAVQDETPIRRSVYTLQEPEASKPYFQKHQIAESCLTYTSILREYGDMQSYANHMINVTGSLSHGDVVEQYSNHDTKCVDYLTMDEADIFSAIDYWLIKAIEHGNEVAQSKYASKLSQQAFFGAAIYTDEQRKVFYRDSMNLRRDLAATGHPESILMLVMLYSDAVNFPEFFDVDAASALIRRYEQLTNKDMSAFLDNLIR